MPIIEGPRDETEITDDVSLEEEKGASPEEKQDDPSLVLEQRQAATVLNPREGAEETG